MADKRIVAVALLTEEDVDLLGPMFNRIWPVEDAPHFYELLEAIDKAEEASPTTSKDELGR
jgi:hypothetical protein